MFSQYITGRYWPNKPSIYNIQTRRRLRIRTDIAKGSRPTSETGTGVAVYLVETRSSVLARVALTLVYICNNI